MALIAENAKDRAEQLLLISDRLIELIGRETALIAARAPPAGGAELEEKNRLANAYRLELARIRDEPALISGAPAPLLDALKAATVRLNEALGAHDLALTAVKLVSEGLVQAMAEEVARQHGGAANYAPGGGLAARSGPVPVALDRRA